MPKTTTIERFTLLCCILLSSIRLSHQIPLISGGSTSTTTRLLHNNNDDIKKQQQHNKLRKIIGTRTTGEGSRHIERSIFYNITTTAVTTGTTKRKKYHSSSSLFHYAIPDDTNGTLFTELTDDGLIITIIDFLDRSNVTIFRLTTSSDNSNGGLHIETLPAMTTPKTTKKSTPRQKKKQRQQRQQQEQNNLIPIEGIYGFYNLPSGMHAVLICESESIFHREGVMDIRKITRMEIVRLPPTAAAGAVGEEARQRRRMLTSGQRKQEERQLRLLRNTFREHALYFIPPSSSSNKNLVTDITHTLQRSTTSPSPLPPDNRFFWNQRPRRPLSSHPLLLSHSPPCTSAFISHSTPLLRLQNNNNNASTTTTALLNYTQLLISRRSQHRAGTRYTRRGSDAYGSVANFCETEQILLFFNNNNYSAAAVSDDDIDDIYSHVQIRGSIPLRWSSPANVKQYNPPLWIGVDPLAQAWAVRRHLEVLWGVYGRRMICFVNLVDKEKSQGRLGRALEAVLRAVGDVWSGEGSGGGGGWRHVWFDFHAECKKEGKYGNLKHLLNDCREELIKQGMLHLTLTTTTTTKKSNSSRKGKKKKKQEEKWRVVSTQDGVFRTNCMDCLDRTNVVQTLFARFILFQTLLRHTQQNTLPTTTTPLLPLSSILTFKNNPLTLPQHLPPSLESTHRHLWADNADVISTLYAGTNALKREYTRYGTRSVKGQMEDGVNSLARYYKNNFEDARKQWGIDLLVGERSFVVESSGGGEEDGGGGGGEGVGNGLEWLPGDLKSCVVPQRMVTNKHQEEEEEEVTTMLHAEALMEIDRRAKSDSPWWVIDSDDDDNNGSSSSSNRNVMFMKKAQEEEMESEEEGIGIGGSQAMVAFVALIKAPLTTVMAGLCLLVPIMLSNGNNDE